MENAIAKKLDRARARIAILESFIETKTRELYHAHEELEQKSRALEALSETLEARVDERTAELTTINRELERFAYIAAHDLREPLRMVASYSELLADRYRGRLDDKADKYIGYVVEGVQRMECLLEELVGYTNLRSKAMSLKSIDAGAVLESVLHNLAPAIREARAEVTIDELPVVVADEAELRQVFASLLDNAIKFRGPDAPRVHVSSTRDAAGYVFSIRDNGIGIEPQYLDRIFVIFQRLHKRNEYPGIGMGLTIAKRIIERHGGRIWVESEPGRGSSFQFQLSAPSERVAL